MGADPEATCEARKASEVVEVPGWEAKGFPLSFAIKVGLRKSRAPNAKLSDRWNNYMEWIRLETDLTRADPGCIGNL